MTSRLVLVCLFSFFSPEKKSALDTLRRRGPLENLELFQRDVPFDIRASLKPKWDSCVSPRIRLFAAEEGGEE